MPSKHSTNKHKWLDKAQNSDISYLSLSLIPLFTDPVLVFPRRPQATSSSSSLPTTPRFDLEARRGHGQETDTTDAAANGHHGHGRRVVTGMLFRYV